MNEPIDQDLISFALEVLSRLEGQGLTLAVAESITGGLIGHTLTETPGASRVFVGGVIAYDNRLKARIGVSEETLQRHGAVSEETAIEMAQGVRAWAGSDVAIAVTGVAGPGGATDAKPAGLTYVAVADGNGTTCERHLWAGDRSGNKRRAAEAALRLAVRRLTEGRT